MDPIFLNSQFFSTLVSDFFSSLTNQRSFLGSQIFGSDHWTKSSYPSPYGEYFSSNIFGIILRKIAWKVFQEERFVVIYFDLIFFVSKKWRNFAYPKLLHFSTCLIGFISNEHFLRFTICPVSSSLQAIVLWRVPPPQFTEQVLQPPKIHENLDFLMESWRLTM